MALFKSRSATARIDDVDMVPDIEAQQETIGRLLRRTREENGLELQQVSQVLRIRYFYLDAIEKGNFDRLPGPAYAAGFIRTYADFLGLDPDSVIQGYRRERDRPKVEGNLTFPTPEQETRIPGAALLLIGLLTAALAYGGWFYLRERPESALDLVPELPDRLANLVDEDEAGEGTSANGIVLNLPSSPAVDLASDDVEPPPASIVQPRQAPSVPASATPEPEEVPASSPEPAGGEAQEAAVSDGDDTLPTEETPPEAPDPSVVPDEPGETAPADDSASPESRLSALGDVVDATEPEPDLGTAIGLPGPQPSPDDDLARVLDELPSPPSAVDEAPPSSEGVDPATTSDQSAFLSAEVAQPDLVIAPDAPTVPVIPPEDADASAPAAVVYGEENVEARVVLQATQDSWVQVRDADGELLLTRVLRPGDIYRAPDREGLTLLTGNAGGLDIFVDGLKLSTLGPVGAVRRNISLDPGSLLADRSGVE